MEMFVKIQLTGIHKTFVALSTHKLFCAMIVLMVPETRWGKTYFATDSALVSKFWMTEMMVVIPFTQAFEDSLAPFTHTAVMVIFVSFSFHTVSLQFEHIFPC